MTFWRRRCGAESGRRCYHARCFARDIVCALSDAKPPDSILAVAPRSHLRVLL